MKARHSNHPRFRPFYLVFVSSGTLLRQEVKEMAVLIHERPGGELVVSECDWPDGVRSFERILTTYYGDSPKSVWEISEQEQRGLQSAVGTAGDIVVLSASRLVIGRDGITVIPDDGVPWLLVRRGRARDGVGSTDQSVSENHGSQSPNM